MKKILKSLIFLLLPLILQGNLLFATKVPDFDQDFLNDISKTDGNMGILDPKNQGYQVDANNTLLENLYNLVMPGKDTFLFTTLKSLALIAIILFIVIEGVKLVIKGKEGGDVKEAAKNL
jgi:hypothetical protein